MSSAGVYPQIYIKARQIAALRNLETGYQRDPWVYFTEARLRLHTIDARRHLTGLFRLDSMSNVSMIPSSWLREDNQLLGPLSALVRFNTPAGKKTGRGRMTRELRFEFPGFAGEYPIELLVATTLATDYGLLALRDLHNHFWMKTSGPLVPPTALALGVVGTIELIPRRK